SRTASWFHLGARVATVVMNWPRSGARRRGRRRLVGLSLFLCNRVEDLRHPVPHGGHHLRRCGLHHVAAERLCFARH
ncbi:unnamed protein product, partial [Musa acuminata subsp. malaccensis]